MTKSPPFKNTDLKPIRELHRKGKIPHFTLRHVLQLCTERKFPCVKFRGAWHSTEAAIDKWFWDHLYDQATPEFKKLTGKSGSQSDE
jgi:hypothetical protein